MGEPVFRLPRLLSNADIVDPQRRPTTTFQQWWQQVVTQIERAITLIVELTGIQEQFELALQQAQQAAVDAQAAADQAQQQTEAAKREAALQGSYIEPNSVLTASTTTIMIAGHTRYYADGTSAVVNAGTAPVAGSPGDVNYVSYEDPMRAGGAVTYIVSDNAPVQTGNTHVVGAVTIPTTGTQPGGRGPLRPGYVEP